MWANRRAGFLPVFTSAGYTSPAGVFDIDSRRGMKCEGRLIYRMTHERSLPAQVNVVCRLRLRCAMLFSHARAGPWLCPAECLTIA